jgi:hypothetical protein
MVMSYYRRSEKFPTRRPFYDRGAEGELAVCRQLIYDRVRHAARKALAELHTQQQCERHHHGEEAKTSSEEG